MSPRRQVWDRTPELLSRSYSAGLGGTSCPMSNVPTIDSFFFLSFKVYSLTISYIYIGDFGCLHHFPISFPLPLPWKPFLSKKSPSYFYVMFCVWLHECNQAGFHGMRGRPVNETWATFSVPKSLSKITWSPQQPLWTAAMTLAGSVFF